MRSGNLVRLQSVLLAALACLAVVIASEYLSDFLPITRGHSQWLREAPVVSAIILRPAQALSPALALLPLSSFLSLLVLRLSPLQRRVRFSVLANCVALFWLIVATLVIGALLNLSRSTCSGVILG
jgi:hypothetical protein